MPQIETKPASVDDLHSFTKKTRNETGGLTISYDGEGAGEMLARTVCEHFIALNDAETAQILAEGDHLVEPLSFDEDLTQQWESFDWHIALRADLYRLLPASNDRTEFKQKVFDLGLSVLRPLQDIIISLKPSAASDWRERAKALVPTVAVLELKGKETNADADSGGASVGEASTPQKENRFLAVISYAHGDDDAKVIALSDSLRREGIDCEIDVYDDAPPEGWPRWMERMMTERTVLVLASKPYYERYHRREPPGTGLGSTFESGLLAQRVVDMQGWNEGVIPVLLRSADARYIPEFLRDVSRYDLSEDDGYEKLYARLTGQARYRKPELGPVRELRPKNELYTTASSDAIDERYEREISETLSEAGGQAGLMIFTYVCRFSLVVHPYRYVADRIPEDRERQVIATARDLAHREFPRLGPERAANLEDGFEVMPDWLKDNGPQSREYYRFRRDGLFVLLRASPDDIGDDLQYVSHDRFVGIGTLLSTITKMTIFAAELAQQYNERTTMRLRVSGLMNHRLVDDLADEPLTLGDIQPAHQDSILASHTDEPAAFAERKLEWARDATAQCLRALNYAPTTAATKEQLQQLQKRMFE